MNSISQEAAVASRFLSYVRLMTTTALIAVVPAPLVFAQSQPTGNQDGGGEAILLGPVRVEADADRARFGDLGPDAGFRAKRQSTATKTPLDIMETPQAVSVTTRDSMDARHVRDVTSALELTAGVNSSIAADGGPFAGRGLGGGEGFKIRGQQLDGKRDVRIDGVVASSNIFDLAAFERIEVVKGPSGFYGQGSLGGFINLIQKKPQAAREISAVVQIASFDTYRFEGDLAGAIVGDTLTGRLTVAYEDGKSFMDHVNTRTALVAPSFELKLGENTRALATVLYQNDKYLPSRGMPLVIAGDEYKAPNVPRSSFLGVPSQEDSSAQNLLATLRVDHEVSDDWLATLVLQGSGQNRQRFFDAYSNQGNLTPLGDVYIYSDTSATDDLNWAGELRLDGKVKAFGRDHKVLVGVEQNKHRTDLAFGYTYLGMGNIYTGSFAKDAVLPGGARNQNFDFDARTTSEATAFYVQTVLDLSERFKLLAGGRYDVSRAKRHDNNTNVDANKTDKEWTTRIGLTYKASDNISAYVTYATSFNPNLDSRSDTGRILNPETGKGYELGLKSEWFDGNLGATAAIYQQDLNNRAITDPNNRNFEINGGLQRVKGAELELLGTPYPGLTLGMAASWMSSKFSDPRDTFFFGRMDVGTVKEQYAFFANYEVQAGTLKGFGAGATLISVGNVAALQYLTVAEQRFVKGYERVDLNLSYGGFKNIDLSLQIRNLFDKVYLERVRDSYQDNFFGAPRAAIFRVKARF